jgi:hypothetical protein
MHRISTAALAAMIAFSSFGCAMSVDDFCSSVVSSEQDKMTACYGFSKELATANIPASYCDRMKKAVDSKRANYDSSKAQACIDLFKNTACADFDAAMSDPTSACNKAISGTVAAGGDCYQDWDCANAGSCSYGNNACPGKCVADARAAVGADCGAGTYCVAGASCASNKCVADVGQGADCSAASCKYSLHCDATSHTCKPGLTSGSCGSSADCAFGYLCAGAPINGNGTCTLAKKSGESCTAGNNECQIGLSCLNGTCTAAKTGSDCGLVSGEYAFCIQGWCNASPGGPGKCVAYKNVGDDCPTGLECDPSAAQCDYTTHKCVAVCLEK